MTVKKSQLATQKASKWLLASGIQNKSKNRALSGGVAAWYELDQHIYPFLYSEITGYALSAFVFLKRIHKNEAYVRAAIQAARWLSEQAFQPSGGVKTRLYLVKHYVSPNYCFHIGRVYAFDTGMVGYGLLQLYKETRDERYRTLAERNLNFLIKVLRKKNGSFSPFSDASGKSYPEDMEKWSDQEGAFHAKIALFLIDFYRLSGDKKILGCAETLLKAAITKQTKEGRFITAVADNSTHLHPHAYTMEGLVYGAVYLKRGDFLESALKAFTWLLKGVSADGSVSSYYSKASFSHHERSDIVAQVLRLGAILYALKPEKIKAHLGVLEKIKQHLLLFQHRSKDKQSGGFMYGAATDGLMRPHLNAWGTLFAIQALWMHDEFVVQKRPLNLESFI